VISRQIDNKESMWNVNENSLLLVWHASEFLRVVDK
jgi:hypothetical protein